MTEVRAGFRTRTAHGTTHGNYPLPCPLCFLLRPLCSLGAEQSPRLPRRSSSLLRLSGLRSPPKCPTSFALPVPSSLVLAGPRCMTLRRHTAHCTFWGRAALWQHAAAPRLAHCPRALRAARSVVGHLVAPFSALPSLTLCPPASASTVRGNSRGRAPSLPPSLPRPPGPVLPPVCSPSLTLPCPPSLVAGSPASCLSVPLLPLSPRRAPCRAMRKATLPLPLSLAAPWCPELLARGTHFVPHTIPPGAGLRPHLAQEGPPSSPGQGAPPPPPSRNGRPREPSPSPRGPLGVRPRARPALPRPPSPAAAQRPARSPPCRPTTTRDPGPGAPVPSPARPPGIPPAGPVPVRFGREGTAWRSPPPPPGFAPVDDARWDSSPPSGVRAPLLTAAPPTPRAPRAPRQTLASPGRSSARSAAR